MAALEELQSVSERPEWGALLPGSYRPTAVFHRCLAAAQKRALGGACVLIYKGGCVGQCTQLEAGDAMLLEAEDRHFAWMLGGPTPEADLRLPAGGVDAPSILEIVRRMAAALRATYGAGSWMIVVDGEVVGLCSYKRPPDLDGVVEIGYGIASSCQNRGHATHAITHLLELALRDIAIRGVVAETKTENLASQRVLERNGFVREGKRIDPADGEVILWRRALSDFRQQE